MKELIIRKFQEHFSGMPSIYAAPGRVNLIGEHTDYNDGFVFPMALDRYTRVAIAGRDDRELRIWSENLQEFKALSLDDNEKRRNHWSDYVAGIARMLELSGFKLPGASMYIESDIPVGSGLSSSAAIIISSALAFLGLVDGRMEGAELARLGQRAENQFVGMNCGIMDQFISIHGQKDHALFLDCRSLDYKLVPLPSEETHIVICNTMVQHELGSSEYNKRRAECEEGVRIMKTDLPEISALRDVSMEKFDSLHHKLPKVVEKRCRHVITENDRVINSISALVANDVEKFGELMNASHKSLRDDYEVSCKELDIMVEIAGEAPGCFGARMTGGGFGGCTVNLVAVNRVDDFCTKVKKAYQGASGLEPRIYISVPSQGAHEMVL